MKKFFAILLGLVIAVPAMAANVNDINRQAYLHHLKEMNGMRKGIVKLLSKSDRTAEEQKMLDELSAKFDEKQAGWDSYLNAVASDDEEGRAVVESKFEPNGKPHKHMELKGRHGMRHHHGRRHHHRKFEGKKCCPKCEGMRHGHKHPKFDGKKPEHKCCPECKKMHGHKHPKFDGKKHEHKCPMMEAKCEQKCPEMEAKCDQKCPKMECKSPEHKCCPKCEKMNCHKHPKFEGRRGHRHPGFGWKPAHKEAKCEEVKAEENKANE